MISPFDSQCSLSLEALPFEWLDMLTRQVQWAIDELDTIIIETLTQAERTHHDQLIRRLLTFKDRLIQERIRRLMIVLDERMGPLNPHDQSGQD